MSEPTFQNQGFELAGAAPGLAAGWTLAHQASVEEIAGYAPAPERAQGDFERGWLGNESFVFAFAPSVLEPALFDETPESVEDFEENWSQNETFLRELVSQGAAEYGPGPKLVEDFDELWDGNEAFAPADLAAAPTEAFESGWRSNESFLFALAPGDLALGPSETFEAGWTPMTTV